jgi:hypothetical protein
MTFKVKNPTLMGFDALVQYVQDANNEITEQQERIEALAKMVAELEKKKAK